MNTYKNKTALAARLHIDDLLEPKKQQTVQPSWSSGHMMRGMKNIGRCGWCRALAG